jgi:hypothetical protein
MFRDFLVVGLMLGIPVGSALLLCYLEDRLRKKVKSMPEQPMSDEQLDKMIAALVDAAYDCGVWDDDLGFAESYHDVVARKDIAKSALVAAFTSLREQLAAAQARIREMEGDVFAEALATARAETWKRAVQIVASTPTHHTVRHLEAGAVRFQMDAQNALENAAKKEGE